MSILFYFTLRAAPDLTVPVKKGSRLMEVYLFLNLISLHTRIDRFIDRAVSGIITDYADPKENICRTEDASFHI
jgi:hypothetical protein